MVASVTYKDISNDLIRLTTGTKTNETTDLTKQDDKGYRADPSCEDRCTDELKLFPVVSIKHVPILDSSEAYQKA